MNNDIAAVSPTAEPLDLALNDISANKQLKAYCNNLMNTPEAQLPTRTEAATRVTQILNQSYAVTLSGGDTIIIKEGLDAEGKRGIAYIKVSSFKLWGGNLWLKTQPPQDKPQDPPVMLKAIDAWLNHPQRRTYDGINFIPNKESDAYYNLWRGWEMDPHTAEGYPLAQRFLTHLFENICDGNNEHCQYLLSWIAHMFQHPEQKPEVAVVLRSEERGTGKSKLAEVLSKLIGFHSTKITQSKHLIGNFNSHLATAILAHVEESFWSGNKADNGILRDMITGHSVNIEAKGRDLVKVPSYHRFILITNNDLAVPASRDERRFFVLDVADHQKQNRSYFKDLTDDLEHGGYGQLMAYLMQYPIEIDINQAPRTKGLENQIVESLEPHERFWMDCLNTGVIGSAKEINESSFWLIANKQLHDEYISYMKRQGIRSRAISDLSFGKKMGKLCPFRKGSQKIEYENRRQNAKQYPSLERCRADFVKVMGLTDVDWET